MSLPGHDRFERLISTHYEVLKAEVVTTVRGKLAVDNLHPDPLDLDAAYNAAWHAFYEQCREDTAAVSNLGGWLATITYRRAIDDIRSARLKYHAPANLSHLGYEPDVDSEIADRQRYHQWLVSVRLRLNARERQAINLCVLHAHSRRDASEIMGIDIKRLDKIMVAANKKLDGLLEAINRGDWCHDQRSLIKAHAFGLHDAAGARHALAIRHITECQACAAYVRSLRGLAVICPSPALASGAMGAGGMLGGLGGLFKGGVSGGVAAGGAGTAAGGGGATLLGGLGAKSAALCVSAVCAAGGAVVVVEETAPQRHRAAPGASTSLSRSASQAPAADADATHVTATSAPAAIAPTQRSWRSHVKRPAVEHTAAPEVAEIGIEPQVASSSTPTGASATPRARAAASGSSPRPAPSPLRRPSSATMAQSASAAEFGIE